jgi:hypothetical protein
MRAGRQPRHRHAINHDSLRQDFRHELARHAVGKWSCGFELKPVLPHPRMETIVQALLEQ